MRLTEDDIQKFQKIYKLKFGKEISKEKAQADGMALLMLIKNLSNKAILQNGHYSD